MNDTQILTIAMSTAPTMLIVLVGILINNARLGDLSSSLNSRLNDMHTRIGETNIRIGELRSHLDVRFEEMKDLWRSELHRVWKKSSTPAGSISKSAEPARPNQSSGTVHLSPA